MDQYEGEKLRALVKEHKQRLDDCLDELGRMTEYRDNWRENAQEQAENSESLRKRMEGAQQRLRAILDMAERAARGLDLRVREFAVKILISLARGAGGSVDHLYSDECACGHCIEVRHKELTKLYLMIGQRDSALRAIQPTALQSIMAAEEKD